MITSHSPLFILGLKNFFGEGGFDLYSLPDGIQISPEDFREFSDAYKAFTHTDTFRSEIRSAVQGAQKPIVFVDGLTDIVYLTRASELLDFQDLFQSIELRDGSGDQNLKKTWKAISTPQVLKMMPKSVVLLHDCDSNISPKEGENIYRRRTPFIEDNPLKKGIENLFSRDTIRKAKAEKSAFIDIDPARTVLRRGETVDIPETWTVNKDEKTNLCNWICKHGTAEDFEGFRRIFCLLQEIPNLVVTSSQPVDLSSKEPQE